jgi:hypothetical protein
MRFARHVTLVLVGAFLGCSGAVIAPMAVSKAAPAAGTWGCYRSAAFPEAVEDPETTQGMNAIAPQAPAGAVLVVEQPKGGRVCVKH